MTTLRPALLLDLGTQDGVSFATFCQAAVRANIPAYCYSVTKSPAPGANRFGAFAKVLPESPLDVCGRFENGSIDLLHIDHSPQHSAEVLYANYSPKLSGRSVILVHGSNDLSDLGGSRALWLRLREQYPFFEFKHGRGLGILLTGENAPDSVRGLCNVDSPDTIAALRSRFSQLGERWALDARQRQAEEQLEALSAEAERHKDSAAAAAALAQRIKQAESDIAQARSDAAEARLNATREILAEQARSDEARREAELTRDHVLRLIEQTQHKNDQEREETRRRTEQDRIDAANLADAALSRVESRHRWAMAEIQAKLEAKEQELAEIQAKLEIREQEMAEAMRRALETSREEVRNVSVQSARKLQDEIAAERQRAGIAHTNAIRSLTSQLDQTTADYISVKAQLVGLRESTIWKLTWPLRRTGEKLPPWLRRGARGAAKIFWWTATFKLFSKLRLRQQLLAGSITGAPAPEPPPSVITPVLQHRAPASSLSVPVVPVVPVRLVYVSGESDTPGHIYRVERFIATALELGYSAISITPPEVPARLEEIAQAQILLLWRTTWGDAVEQAVSTAKKSGARVVYDVDDLMFDPAFASSDIIDAIRSASLDKAQVGAHFSAVQRCVLEADICVTTTEELAQQLRGLGKRTFVLPNGFDRGLHATARQGRLNWQRSKHDSLIRIGYAGGSRTHQRDFGCAVEGIAKLMREMPDVRLVLFQTPDGLTSLVDVHEFPALAGLEDRIEWRSMQTVPELPNELARFDINIAPLEFGNPFCEGKSELKFWEAALVEVPTVASPTGPFRRAIQHGKTGFLASSADEWYFYLKQLAMDPELRAGMSRAAYYAALASFGSVDRRLRYSRVIQQLMGGQIGANAFALGAQLASRPKRNVQLFPSDIVYHKPAARRADVTVIVPLYNYEQYIEEALDSVAAQTLELLDLVIVDGFSTDNSLKVAKAWAEQNEKRFNRLLLLKNQANYGLAFCRNSGFDAADTPYVLPLDADNRLLPACCKNLLDTIREKASAFVYPSIQLFGDSQAVIGGFPFDPQGLVPSNYIDAMAMIDREAWAFVGGYDHIPVGWEDYDFWCRLAETGLGGEWHNEVLAEYRVHNKSIIRTLGNEKYLGLFDDFTSRHPWVWLGEQQVARRPPPCRVQLSAPEHRARLDYLLPLLRCPVTHEKLALTEEGNSLVSLGGLKRWPLADGRPVFIKGGLKAVMEAKKIAALPDRAITLAEATEGYVLQLGAADGLADVPKVIKLDHASAPLADLLANLDNLPLDDETVSAVILFYGDAALDNSSNVFSEIYRVLKPHGRLFIGTPAAAFAEAWMKDYEAVFSNLQENPQSSEHDGGPATRYEFIGTKLARLPDLKKTGR